MSGRPSGNARVKARALVPDADSEERWQRRRWSALTLRATMVVAPIGGSVAAMAVLSRVLPTPKAAAGMAPRLAWWAAVLVGSLVALWCVDRLTRRLAPLAALLDMAVLFPCRAPTRLRVARRAGDVRQLQALTKASDKRSERANARADAERAEAAQAAEQILALVGSLRAHDRHTRGHSERVRAYTDLIAEELRLPAASVDRLRWAALLHDIGKLRVPTGTLNKPAKLSAHEWEMVKEHPAEGARLAKALLPWLGEWGRAIIEHHERFDGSGYPSGLEGRDISLAARIVAVADVFEVMTAPRAYKKAMTRAVALAEIVRAAGSQFDPDVVRAFLHVSTPRLCWAMGPTSWLVGTPVLGAAPSLTGAGIAAQAAVGVTTVAVAGMSVITSPVSASTPHVPPAGASAAVHTNSATASTKPSVARDTKPDLLLRVRPQGADPSRPPSADAPPYSRQSSGQSPRSSLPAQALPAQRRAAKPTAPTPTAIPAPGNAATPPAVPVQGTVPTAPPSGAPTSAAAPANAAPGSSKNPNV